MFSFFKKKPNSPDAVNTTPAAETTAAPALRLLRQPGPLHRIRLLRLPKMATAPGGASPLVAARRPRPAKISLLLRIL
jgi:hypothetical protein